MPNSENDLAVWMRETLAEHVDDDLAAKLADALAKAMSQVNQAKLFEAQRTMAIMRREADISVEQQPQTLEQMEQEVFEVNTANGWFDDKRTVGDDIALLHTEVSEMFEAYRDHQLADVTGTDADKPDKPLGFGSECADVLIRLLDTTRRREVNLRREFERKLAFNRTRGYKHGGRTI